MVYLYLDGSKVIGVGTTPSSNSVSITVDAEHEVLKNPLVFRYENGRLVKDTVYQQQKIEEVKRKEKEPSLKEQVDSLKKQNADLMFHLMLKGVL